MEDFDAAMEGKMTFSTPNFDLFLKLVAPLPKRYSLISCSLILLSTSMKNGMPAIRNVIAMNWQQWDAVRGLRKLEWRKDFLGYDGLPYTRV